MTEEELEKLKNMVTAEVLKGLAEKELKAVNIGEGKLAQVHNQYKEALYETFGMGTFARVWDEVRKLVCHMMGVKYVRDLSPWQDEEAAKYAEWLIKIAIDARKSSNKTNKNN